MTSAQPRAIDLHRLLQRFPLPIDEPQLRERFADKRVLITGAGGSIGSELASLMTTWRPQRLALLDNHEFSLFDLQTRLSPTEGLSFYLGDVRERARLDDVFGREMPHIVIHLAAYKHVPLGEANPDQTIRNNIIGSYNVLNASVDHGVERLAFSSTDKAVDPPNVYGASKRFVELLLMSHGGATHTGIVRLVNAVGAQGGVIRHWQNQLANGQPVTLTDAAMTRYWISIREAALLVAQAACLVAGFQIIVPEISKPTGLREIVDRLSAEMAIAEAREPTITGLRPGEKMHEALHRRDERLEHCPHPGVQAVRRASGVGPDWAQLRSAIAELEQRLTGNRPSSSREQLFDFLTRYDSAAG